MTTLRSLLNRENLFKNQNKRRKAIFKQAEQSPGAGTESGQHPGLTQCLWDETAPWWNIWALLLMAIKKLFLAPALDSFSWVCSTDTSAFG